MSIHIHNSKSLVSANLNAPVHYLPCKIYADDDAKVKEYFETSITKDDKENFHASFRGYPLVGCDLKVPEGYKGVIFYESIKPSTDQEDRKFYVTHHFNSFKYWNCDKAPSKNDEFAQALDWIDIAEALHESIKE